MCPQIATELAKFVVETRYSDIPQDVVDFTKGLMLKTVAGTLAGSATPSGRKISHIIKSRNLGKDAGVIGCGFKTSLWESILLNAFLAHASELEDDSFVGGVSWDITVIPLLLPLAEHLRISGKNLIEALVIGLEVHTRTCSFPTNHLGIVVFPGAVGPAAAGAKALGLGVEETVSALGLAMSAPAISLLNLGTDAHFLESALQSSQGIIAAEMAKEGMTGNPDIEAYLTNFLGKERVDPEKMIKDLGKEWQFQNIGIKKYPCCFFTHRQIDVILELKKEHHLSLNEVEKIEVHASPADEWCNRPEPKSLGDLQFSFQHLLGAAILDGDVNFDNVDINVLSDPQYVEARSKVDVIIHPDRSPVLVQAPAEVIIKMKNGKKISRQRMHTIGSRQEPLSPRQFRELYSKFTKGILADEQIEKSVEAILNTDKLSDLLGLMNMLTFTHTLHR
jgi:2-methylcitrate dehydratase PrpD